MDIDHNEQSRMEAAVIYPRRMMAITTKEARERSGRVEKN
jgi:hypothetical protein